MTLAERMGGHRFKVGQRVRFSEYARGRFILPKSRENAIGTVTKVDEFGCPTVRWDHRKTASGYNWAFIEPIRKTEPRA
ncbi:MAG: hypothetical protein KF889_25605 [Alphaproteobacteria bacterium]|nr:hypothetical protein [Alphaproteobacteria bacterium]MCW5739628.1 hypothetical protein [Alphaproteobacteria bacterium]